MPDVRRRCEPGLDRLGEGQDVAVRNLNSESRIEVLAPADAAVSNDEAPACHSFKRRQRAALLLREAEEEGGMTKGGRYARLIHSFQGDNRPVAQHPTRSQDA